MRATAVGAALLGCVLVTGAWLIFRPEAAAPASAMTSAADTPAAPDVIATFRHGVDAARKHDYAAAEVAFRKVEPHWAILPNADFFVALVEARLGRLEPAESAARRYVAATPADIAGANLLAHIQLQAGHPERAVATLQAAAGAIPLGIDELELLGRAAARAGDPERAARVFDMAVALAPDDSAVQTRLAAARQGLPERQDAIDPEPAVSPPGATEAAVHAALRVGDVDRAGAALDAMRRLPGGEGTARILDGVIKVAKLDFAGARAVFAADIAANPKSTRARLNLARLDVLEGKPDDAGQRLSEVLRADPADMPALQSAVGLLLARNNVQPAVALLEAARASAPASPVFTVMLVDFLLQSGDGARALSIIDAASREVADLTAVMSARARALVAVGRVNEARDVYGRIVAREPDNAGARAQSIDLLLARNDFDGAKALLRDALRAGINRLATMEGLLRVEFRARGLEGATAMADQLAADPGNLPLARVLKGDLYLSGQHYPEAIAAYAEQIRVAPSSSLIARLASALAANGQGDQAALVLRNWLVGHAEDAEALAALGSLELGTRHPDDAIAHLSAALQKQPDNAAVLNDLAWAYQLKGDPRARDLARRAYVAAPTAEIADTLGWIIATTGQPAVAVGVLREAAAAMPGNPTVLYHYAAALSGAGLPRDAARVVTAALGQPVNFAERRAAGQLLSDLSRRP